MMEKTLTKIVYKDGDEIKTKKGTFVSEDEYTITIRTLKKDITIGKSFIVETSQQLNNMEK